MNDDAVDGTGFFESHELPGLACIHGSVYAISHVQRVSRVSFTSTHPNDVWVFLIDGNGTYGMHLFIIKNRLPSNATRSRLPKAARGRAGIHNCRIIVDSINGSNSTAHRAWADASRFHGFKNVHVDLLCLNAHLERSEEN